MANGSIILGPNQLVTGVRGWAGTDVVLTGSSVSNGVTSALLYLGPLYPTDSAGICLLTPAILGQDVTSATFYGPDTYVFNPDLGEGKVRVVGSYQYSGGSARNCGMVYQGTPQGDGGWSSLEVPAGDVGGQTVWNTIAHSTMGDLVVGNYDLLDVPLSGNAFIFDIAKGTWRLFDFPGCTLTTAYGIWQNEIGGTRYTIVGGTRDGHGINKGFVVAYDSGDARLQPPEALQLSEPAAARHPFRRDRGDAEGLQSGGRLDRFAGAVRLDRGQFRWLVQ